MLQLNTEQISSLTRWTIKLFIPEQMSTKLNWWLEGRRFCVFILPAGTITCCCRMKSNRKCGLGNDHAVVGQKTDEDGNRKKVMAEKACMDNSAESAVKVWLNRVGSDQIKSNKTICNKNGMFTLSMHFNITFFDEDPMHPIDNIEVNGSI